ncbi:hypothetical protein OG819_41305 [Streptomyces sp. NBC_01549]|uniref:hypothetical protein n=1 Tax=Streptomyces sp. NBC_01549 TaxID=2975874 RepID=UPI00224EB7EE|nr:hypothetical protein [Streptomyces sp. NBC_01549]MCX4595868.1 hypothetical protein [Streptomyces sp. NBC_01549]
MNSTERPGAAATGGAPDVCQLLREQLVEMIASVRSHATMTHGLAFDGAGDRPATGQTAGRADGGDFLSLAEDAPSW